MEHYIFKCRRCQSHFEKDAQAPSQNFHLLLGLITLGGWLIIYAFIRLFNLYRLSSCPDCGRRSRFLLSLLIVLIVGSLEVNWVIYYFLEIAPQKIVQDASMTTLPENIDLESDISSENALEILTFVWIVGILPSAGAMIAMNWPYILLTWFSIVVVVGLGMPSFYLRKSWVG